MGFISFSFFKLNKNERKSQNFKACEYPGPFTSLSHKEECWNNVYFSGLLTFFLHYFLVPEMIHWLSVYYSYNITTRQFIWKSLFILSLLRKDPGNKTFLLICTFKEHLSFVLCFLLDSDFILIRKASGTILGHLKFVYYMNWVNHGRMTVSFSPHCWISLKLQFSIWAAQTLVHSSISLFFILGTCI